MENNVSGELFSETNRQREKLNKALYSLDFFKAIALLEACPDDHENLTKMVEALNELIRLTGPEATVAQLSELFFNYDSLHSFQSLEKYNTLIRKGLARAITARLDSNVHEFLSENIHGSEFPLFLGEQHKAITACKKYLATRKPDPRVYQLLSFAQLRNNQKKQAINCEAMAVFLNPLKIDTELIHNETIKTWVEKFQKYCTFDTNEVVQELLVELLKMIAKKILPTPHDKPFFYHLEKLIINSDPSILEYKDRILKTVRLLFVLENVTMAQDFKKATFTYREMLKNLNPRFHDIYINYIKTYQIN